MDGRAAGFASSRSPGKEKTKVKTRISFLLLRWSLKFMPAGETKWQINKALADVRRYEQYAALCRICRGIPVSFDRYQQYERELRAM